VPATNELRGALHNIATQLRIDSIEATTAAGSGHPTSSMSAAEIMAALFFSVMRFDPKNPQNPDNDRFVLSKGHAAPVLYSTWAELGFFPREHLLTLRRLDSDLEGHPTPHLRFVSVPTGSLGQGLPVGLGMALSARMDGRTFRTYVLMGDGETAEGSVWEAAEVAGHDNVDNLCAIVDVNRLGQSQPTMLQHHMEIYQRRWAAFGWNALVVDGHDIAQLLKAFETAAATKNQPTVVLAHTYKGRGVTFLEDKEGWHGKALKPEEATRAVAELKQQFTPNGSKPQPAMPSATPPRPLEWKPLAKPTFDPKKAVATREAFGEALAKLGQANPQVVALDGDVKNSTFTEKLESVAPQHFVEGYIAEQNMTGMAMGLAACGKVPFVSTFACFLTRAADFIRLAGLAGLNVKFVGTHAGVSIGEDGASQMGLEDLALFRTMAESTVLYPSDAVSTWKAVELAAHRPGIVYIRTGRPKSPILYSNDEEFAIGGGKVLRCGSNDAVAVVAAGVTIEQALKAYDKLKQQGIEIQIVDLFSVRPVDRDLLLQAARSANNTIVTVEDHYLAGGIGDAVSEAVAPEGVRVIRMGIAEVPHSGTAEELLHKYGIDADAITARVLELAPVARR
jgi:transketolase